MGPDYSLEVLGVAAGSRWRRFRTMLPESVGASLCLTLTLLVPGLTLLVAPLMVIGLADIMGEKGDASWHSK